MQHTDRLNQLLNHTIRPRILVLGDVMLDHSIVGDAERISPEAPVPVINIERETWTLGGAANVAHNLKALGAFVTLFGLVGQDENAWRLRSLAQDMGIDTHFFADNHRPTTVKTRVIARGQQLLRLDHESRKKMGDDLRSLVSQHLTHLHQMDVIVISDYAKGFITPELMDSIREIAAKINSPVMVDPKPANAHCYKGTYLITPNLKEAEAMSGIKIRDISSAQEAARSIKKRLEVQAVLVTLGPKGMVLYISDELNTHLPTRAKDVFDVTGAGDTVIAVLAWALAKGASLEDAAYLANVAAGIVVAKVGTATTSTEELAGAL